MLTLIDADSGNLLGTYPNEEQALRAVLETVQDGDLESIDAVVLVERQQDGSPRPLASGRDLVALARRRLLTTV